MAVSAFRSTSRRGNSSLKGEESNNRGSNRGRAEDKAALPTRRSRSVSAALPTSSTTTTTDNASASPISSSSAANHLLHFDNPLFASSHQPPTLTPPPTNNTNATPATSDDSRGRPMARTSSHFHSSSSAPRKCVGRSLSHTRSRGRSASRPPSRCYSHEVPFFFSTLYIYLGTSNFKVTVLY